MDEAPLLSEGLANNLHAAAKIVVSRRIRADGFKVALTGEGADEAFLGYEHFRYDFPVGDRPLHADENPLSAGVMRPADGRVGDAGGVRLDVGGIPSWIAIKARAGGTLTSILGERLRGVRGGDWRLPEEVARDLREVGPVERARATWIVYAMSGYILRGLDDPMGMGCGVESRLPFLDPRVQRAAALVPPRDHYAADGLEKGSLRRALAGVLPDEVLARPKRAFLVPSLLGTPEGAAWARERLLGGPLASSRLFDRAGMSRLLEASPSPVRDGAVYTLAGLSRLMDGLGLR
jgi:asparagine synthase (glutamine-hydrolysing)